MTTQVKAPTEIQKRPNIVFILIDDMGWKDLGCQGSNFYETPNIDRIAEEGIKFNQAYASCPVCSPTRASILTGKYPPRVGITQWIGGKTVGKVIGAPYTHYLPLEEKSLAKKLKEHGYKTYHVGKWHLGDEPYWPEKHGFDINVAGCHWGNPWEGFFSPYNMPNLENGPKGEYLTDRLTDEAIKILKQNGDDPFFLYLPYYSVHKPIQAPEEEIKKFEEKRKKMGLDDIEEVKSEKIDFYLENHTTEYIKRRKIQGDATYGGMIHRLDKNVGKILSTLKEIGEEENTIVLFYSDNGGLSDSKSDAPTSNAPLRYGKSYVYEGGIREPLLIRWPKIIPKGVETNAQITSPDFYPTILDCCNIPQDPDQHKDGKSFFDILSNPSKPHKRGPIFWHYPHYNGNGAHPGSIVIDGKWKLIEWHEDGNLELYNLEEDIGETNNLANQELDVVKDLYNLLQNWKQEVDAIMPRPNPNYNLILAKVKIHATGKLLRDDRNQVILKTQLFKRNPQIFDVPIQELIQEILNKTLLLKIGEYLRTGRFLVSDKTDVFLFEDIHEENRIPFSSLAEDYIGEEIELRAWDEIPEDPENQDEKPLPQVELKLKPDLV